MLKLPWIPLKKTYKIKNKILIMIITKTVLDRKRIIRYHRSRFVSQFYIDL
jgi:hypothetical protein